MFVDLAGPSEGSCGLCGRSCARDLLVLSDAAVLWDFAVFSMFDPS